MPRSRRVTLASRPSGMPRESDFSLDVVDVGEPNEGEVLVRMLWGSVDPYQRGRMNDARSYAAPLQIGEVMTSQSVGEVVATRDRRFSAGDLVVGQLGWQEYALARAGTLRRVPPARQPPSLALAAAGGPALRASCGLLDGGQPAADSTL